MTYRSIQLAFAFMLCVMMASHLVHAAPEPEADPEAEEEEAPPPPPPLYRGGFQYNDAGQTPPKDDSLFQALGGISKIAAFTKDFVALIVKDPQIGKYFVGVKLKRLTRRLTDQFIDLSGGPVAYKGNDMTKIHKSMNLTNRDFNRLAEDLQIAMDQNNIPFATQNRLLGLLAPMQRVIVTK